MARRKRGRPIDGWLVVDKPAGYGSTDLVAIARRAFDARKAGHAGTLDPAATGVLAIAFGEATKTVGYAMAALKTYRFTVRWGAATATDDAESAPIAVSSARPSREEIEAALPLFRGAILQRPPGVSAIKVAGRRAYDLAREGAPPELAPRPIQVEALELVETPDADTAVLEMTCGKGGYVRAIARDLGERLGCLGHVARLRRTRAGPFDLSQAISFETLRAIGDRGAPTAALLPVAAGLDDIPAFDVDEQTAAWIQQGRATLPTGAPASAPFASGAPVWARSLGRPVAIGVFEGGLFVPKRVFNPAETEPTLGSDDQEDDDVDHR